MSNIKVGVGVMIMKNDKVLLAKRKGSHGEGEYAFPGGHLEDYESFDDCARRETLEECGVKITNVRFQYLANVISYTPKHYVHVGLIADWNSGDPQLLEPNKADSWDWYELDRLPQPLFKMCSMAIVAHHDGKNYFDIPEVPE